MIGAIFVGFWIFLFIMCMILPLIMIIFGKIFLKGAPKKINSIYGYRTKISMRNEGTWKAAHKYIGELWYRWGIVLLVASAGAMCFSINMSEDKMGIFSAIIEAVQLAAVFITIYIVEKRLRREFGK